MNTFFTITQVMMSVMTAVWHTMPDNVATILFCIGLFICGALASFVNMLSGGGSMIVLGFMMLLGVDPVVANATNRVGVLAGTGFGAAAFKSEKYTDLKESLKLGLWSVPGAVAGAFFSVSISGDIYENILAVVMILIVISMFFPKRTEDTSKSAGGSRWTWPAMFVVGFYGGVVQVGVGILIYATLRHLGNLSLMRINMHRVFIVLIFIIPSMIVFIWSGKINWTYAAALCSGNALGAWLTVKWTLTKGEKVIRLGLVVSVILMSVKFLIF